MEKHKRNDNHENIFYTGHPSSIRTRKAMTGPCRRLKRLLKRKERTNWQGFIGVNAGDGGKQRRYHCKNIMKGHLANVIHELRSFKPGMVK